MRARSTAVLAFASGTAILLSATAIAASSLEIQADAVHTPHGPLVRFLAAARTSGPQPTIRSIMIARPGGLAVRTPRSGATVGTLVFFVNSDKPSNRRIITLHGRRGSRVIGSGHGVSVVLRPTSRRLVTISLPSGNLNPVLSFNGTGARLFAFDCRSTTFVSSITPFGGPVTTHRDEIPAARLRRAGLC